MNKNKFNLRQIFIRLILLAGIALLSACAKSALSTVPSVKTDAPAVSEASPSQVAMPVSLDADPMGLTFHIESISAPDDPGSLPYWENMPAYTLLTLENYPLSDHRLEPKIYLFPLADLALVNHQAGQIAEDLGELLAYPQDQLELPFLPLKNARQMNHTQIKTLQFKTGQGLRYLTQFGQGISPLNNQELVYTFQGLTGDGKYYVAAVFPVQHPDLPPDDTITGEEPQEFNSDYLTYLDNIALELQAQPADTFTPDLTLLDALIESLEIR